MQCVACLSRLVARHGNLQFHVSRMKMLETTMPLSVYKRPQDAHVFPARGRQVSLLVYARVSCRDNFEVPTMFRMAVRIFCLFLPLFFFGEGVSFWGVSVLGYLFLGVSFRGYLFWGHLFGVSFQ